jgi:hypothetical protein
MFTLPHGEEGTRMTANRRVVHTLVFTYAPARGSSRLAQSGSSTVPAPDRAQFGQSTCKP